MKYNSLEERLINDPQKIISDVHTPTFAFEDLPLQWLMSKAEKYTLSGLLQYIQPEVSIEIGTYKGGSLQCISQHSKKVYSIDNDPEVKELLGEKFQNVEILIGSSFKILPTLLNQITNENEKLGFILIDGDHSYEGVKRDINAVLEYVPECPVYIIFHDSFNPECRKGIIDANWQKCPYVHYLEIDFIGGHYILKQNEMWAGFALAVMFPEKRKTPLIISQSQYKIFNLFKKLYIHPKIAKLLRLLFNLR